MSKADLSEVTRTRIAYVEARMRARGVVSFHISWDEEKAKAAGIEACANDACSAFEAYLDGRVTPWPHRVSCGWLFRPGSLWIGAHYSPTNRRWCINLLPMVTVWICLKGGVRP